jgi:hypothetical protein
LSLQRLAHGVAFGGDTSLGRFAHLFGIGLGRLEQSDAVGVGGGANFGAKPLRIGRKSGVAGFEGRRLGLRLRLRRRRIGEQSVGRRLTRCDRRHHRPVEEAAKQPDQDKDVDRLER